MIAASVCGWNALSKDLLEEEKTNLSNMGLRENDKGPLNNQLKNMFSEIPGKVSTEVLIEKKKYMLRRVRVSTGMWE